MRIVGKLVGFVAVTGILVGGLATLNAHSGKKGEVKIVFSSSTHGYFDPCG